VSSVDKFFIFLGCGRPLCGYSSATADPRIVRKEKSCPQMTQMNTDEEKR
jgi:hypothetical protein